MVGGLFNGNWWVIPPQLREQFVTRVAVPHGEQTPNRSSKLHYSPLCSSSGMDSPKLGARAFGSAPATPVENTGAGARIVPNRP